MVRDSSRRLSVKHITTGIRQRETIVAKSCTLLLLSHSPWSNQATVIAMREPTFANPKTV
jgi:hypothetical protein